MVDKKIHKDYKFKGWVWIVFGVVCIFYFINNPIILVSLIIFLALKPSFTRCALEIKQNPVVPFFIVLALGLIGYLGYYAYYKYQLKRLKTGKGGVLLDEKTTLPSKENKL